MAHVLERDRTTAVATGVDERPARAELRRQIGRLERELAGHLAAGFGRTEVPYRVEEVVAAPPRVLDLGDLERTRDALAERVADAKRALECRAAEEEFKRELLRQMIARPAEFKWVRISRAELGEPGCGHWHSKPRLGPIGMLMGWWRVKVSSGCPLAGRLAAVERQATGEENETRGTGEAGARRVASRFPREARRGG